MCNNKCILCQNQLQKRKDGLVCKNPKCKLYWKFSGWVYRKKCHFCKKVLLTSKELGLMMCDGCKKC